MRHRMKKVLPSLCQSMKLHITAYLDDQALCSTPNASSEYLKAQPRLFIKCSPITDSWIDCVKWILPLCLIWVDTCCPIQVSNHNCSNIWVMSLCYFPPTITHFSSVDLCNIVYFIFFIQSFWSLLCVKFLSQLISLHEGSMRIA